MLTVLSNTRNANLYLVVALAITLAAILAFVVVPSIGVPNPALVPVTGSQNAYVEFLHGEKVLYGNPSRMSEALAAYHLREKAIYASAVDASGALSVWRFGKQGLLARSGWLLHLVL